ncbi:MAG TPA: YraN family protein [Candidatus Saccharimonadales bacterium]|nr:YraN family protein [Candidatus Saccharimonadales bacterium]
MGRKNEGGKLMVYGEAKRKLEKSARLYLEMRGFLIKEQNWGSGKNKIDLIAFKAGLIHFIEVNYIKDTLSDTSVDVLTESRLKQIKDAIDAWMSENRYTGQYVFSTLQLSGQEMAVVSFNESIL